MIIGIDTNIILNILRADDPIEQLKGSLEFFKRITKRKVEVAISVITLTELFRKPFKKRSLEEKKKLDAFLHTLNARIINIDNGSAIEAARLIEEAGLKFADALIASSLLFSGVEIFITRNVKDFKATSLIVQTPEEYLNSRG